MATCYQIDKSEVPVPVIAPSLVATVYALNTKMGDEAVDRSRCPAHGSTMPMAFEFTLIMFLKGVCSWIRMLDLSSFCLIPAIPISSRNPMTSFQESGGERGARAEHRGG
jgi:hypothetical protein